MKEIVLKKSKNYVTQISFILIVTLLLSCNTTKSIQKSNPSKPDLAIINPSKQEECCDLKYPALQAEVSGTDVFSKQFEITSFRHTDGNFRYKLKFNPSNNFKSISQSYINYVKALYPCATGSGSRFKISKGNFGPGHTTRYVVKPNYVGFNANGSGGIIINSPSDFWDLYYDVPTVFPPSVTYSGTHSSQNGLSYNEIYSLEYGYWIDGCNNLTDKEKKCLGYHNYVNFSINVSNSNLRTTNSNTGTLKLYNDNGKLINEMIVKIN